MNKSESHKLNEELFRDLAKEFNTTFDKNLNVEQLKTIIKLQQRSMAKCVKEQKSFWVPNIVRLMFSEIKADKLGVEIINKPVELPVIGGLTFASETLTDKSRRRNVL